MPTGADMEFGGTDRFAVRRRLGAGAMGVVYEAIDRERNAPIALKTLRHLDAQALYRFKREFRALQGLRHPNVVSLGELIESRGEWFFTMELVEGVDFLDWVWRAPAARGEADTIASLTSASGAADPGEDAAPADPSPPDVDEMRLRDAARQLARGLVAIHDAGLIHRDVKPSNIRVTSAGRVVLLDFGLIAERDSLTSTDGTIVGTAAYMAPEIAEADAASPALDWYSFGVVLYQALTGAVPFPGRNPLSVLVQKQKYVPAPPRSRAPNVPEDLDALCAELIRRDPRARPAGATVLQLLGAGPAPAPADAPSQSIREIPFIGRTAQLDALHAAYRDVAAGGAVTVTVHGASGLGKSSLLQELARRVRRAENDVLVLAGRCYERESVPYKAFDGMIDAVAETLRRLPKLTAASLVPRWAGPLRQVFPSLQRVEAIAQAPQRRVVQDPRELRNRAFAGLRELLGRLADQYNVIAVIDDLQWADADSLLLLRELLRPPDPPPILLLISSRDEPGAAPVELPGDARTVELEPLPPELATELAGMLAERLGLAGDADLAAIASEAQGHPMFIDELVRYAARTGHANRRVRLDEAIWERIALHDEDAIHVLQLVTLAGTPLPQQVIRDAAEMAPDEFARTLSVLRAAQLVRGRGTRGTDRIEPFHDRIAETVRAHIAEQTRTTRHRRLAVALESAQVGNERPELLLRHFEAAGDTARAARWAREAAERATDTLAFDRAAELYRAALRLGEHDDDALRALRSRLADSLAAAGRGVEAADAYLLAADSADPTTRREHQRHAAEQLLITGHIERGLATIEQLLTDAGASLPRTARRTLAALLWERLRLRLRGLRWTERHEREIADSELARLDVIQKVSDGLAAVDTMRGAVFQTRSLRMALSLGERNRIVRALGMEAIYHAGAGGRGAARARELIDEMDRLTDRGRDPQLAPLTVFADGVVSLLAGEFGDATDKLIRSEAHFRDERVGATMELNNTRLFLVEALYFRGDLGAVVERIDDYVRDAERRGDLYAATSFRCLGNARWLARDQPEQAHRDIERAAWTPPEGGFHLQHWYELWARAELALYEGTFAGVIDELQVTFDRLSRSLLMKGIQMTRAAAQWLRGRLALALADANIDVHRQARIAERCARKLRRERVNYAAIWGALLRAGAAATLGETDRAAAALEQVEAGPLMLAAAAAQRRRGQLIEDAGLIDRADGWMAGEGIAAPARLVRMVAPGFARRRYLSA